MLGVASSAGATTSSARAATGVTLPSCVVRPELTEGPFFVDEKLGRSDVRSDPSSKVIKPGVPLVLSFLVSKVGTGMCAPLSGAMVDI